ncbi:Tyrosine-sulfated glycopeptide receptor 1 [Morella rubra]|uniref:Tyrosine-sulfated glycopeptide receptor 1 n=1 Tax=Morella rubra TaxID=262757 RepID=A0A6A1WQG2_9ROSI|nr:Tyrosine-sulfated glycopeptide receptor 1 [Morella rubra]
MPRVEFHANISTSWTIGAKVTPGSLCMMTNAMHDDQCDEHGDSWHMGQNVEIFHRIRRGDNIRQDRFSVMTVLSVKKFAASGFLPTRLFSLLNQLKIVDFSNNNLKGDISSLFSTNGSSLCINSPFIKVLDFSFNHYSGQIPSKLGGCSKLEVFRVGFNSLSGPLPPDIYSATRLKEIYLPANNLSGVISNDIVNLTRLVNLELYRNNIGGKLPGNIGKLSQLEHLILHKNSFIGALPPSLMNCTNLIELKLALNFFEGEISTLNFSGLSQLAVLDLEANDFTGNFPASLYSCKFLRAIQLSNNRLEGEIRTDVVQLKFLTLLSLTESKLTNITKAIKILMHSLVSQQPLDNTCLDLPSHVSDSVREYNSPFKLGRVISLVNNSLSGSIPIEIGHLKQLQLLDLSYNNLSGKIPYQIVELTNLEILDLSANQLIGEIPASLANLHFLNKFRIASNKLYGPIPLGTQLQSFDASDYEGNSGLCGPPLPNICPHITGNKGDKDIHDEENGHVVPWLHISVVLGFITGFWGVCGPLAVNNRWRFAYFRFMDDIKDRIYVKSAVSFGQLRRRLTKL